MRQEDNARSLEDDLLRLQDEVGPDDARLEPMLLEIAREDRSRGRPVRARALVRRVIAMRSARLGPSDPGVQELVALALPES